MHICLQSGSDRVLRRMRRRWSARSFLQRCDLLRQTLDKPAFTTDLMVGFPGEDEADFQASCQVAREVGFSKIHIFPFSPRRGTPAADMPDQLPKVVKSDRSRRLAEVERALRRAYFDSLVGEQLQVLVENVDSESQCSLGTACRYAPTQLSTSVARPGELITAQVTEATDDRVLAQPLVYT